MSDCCTPSNEPRASSKISQSDPVKHRCPSSGQLFAKVASPTMLHHIKEPWKHPISDQTYYFCDDPACDVVYFGIDDAVITKKMMRTRVGVKETSDDALICYCFGVSKAEAKLNKSSYEFVLEETKKSSCSCKTSNPSGRCCLKDFPKT